MASLLLFPAMTSSLAMECCLLDAAAEN